MKTFEPFLHRLMHAETSLVHFAAKLAAWEP